MKKATLSIISDYNKCLIETSKKMSDKLYIIIDRNSEFFNGFNDLKKHLIGAGYNMNIYSFENINYLPENKIELIYKKLSGREI